MATEANAPFVLVKITHIEIMHAGAAAAKARAKTIGRQEETNVEEFDVETLPR